MKKNWIVEQAARLESYASYSEFIKKRTALLLGGKVIRRDNMEKLEEERKIKMEIRDILEPNEYNSLNQFSQEEDKDWINGRIKIRRNGSAGIECVKRGMNRDGDCAELTPEEIVRQHYAHKLAQ
ncbi:MAG: hypothetical protein ACLR7D_09445 [Lachnospira eligens]